MTKLRVAVVGTGAIARIAHLPALRQLGDEVEVIALVDLDPAIVAAVAAEWDVPNAYTDVDRMLAAERPDLVVVGTPPGTHGAIVTAALDAGAWVWWREAATLSLEEYDRIAEHERAGGPYACYVFQQRFGSSAERLRRLVADGALGRCTVAVCNTLWFRNPAYFAAPWRGRWDTEGGGPTMGHGIHQMDLGLSVLGDWTEVTAVMATLARDTQTEDVSMAMVRLESGALWSITNSLLSPRESTYLRFDFEDATVEVEHVYAYDNSHWRWTPAQHVTDLDIVAGWPPDVDESSAHLTQLRGLTQSMRRGERPAASGADGRRVLELVAGMYASALTGRSVRRDELVAGHPFLAAMHGGDPDRATATLTAGRLARAGRG